MGKFIGWAFIAVIRCGYKLLFRVKVIGKDNLPQSGRTIIAANHISSHDPILLRIFVHPHIRFMAKDELFRTPFIGWVIRRAGAYPVIRTTIGIGAIRHSIRLLSDNQIVGIFPEGTRNRRRCKMKAKPGVGFIATKAGGVSIVPIAITLRPRQWFRRSYIVVGEPIFVTDTKSIHYRDLADAVMTTVYELGAPLPNSDPKKVRVKKVLLI